MSRIAEARVIVTCPGRNFVTLKLVCDDGTTGVGDATLNGRELAVEAYLREHVCPMLIGRDAGAIEDTWRYLYNGAYWRRGPVTMTAIAAVDCALWDIKGKRAGMPVYELLGGRCRTGVTVYGHANGQTVEDVLEAVQSYVDLGYRAVRVQAGIPGLASTYGVSGAKMFYEPAEGGLAPREETWSTRQYLRSIGEVLGAVRERFGHELELLHDVHHRLSPIEAAQLGKLLEPHQLFWLEDPVPAELQASLRVIRAHTTTPIAIGEVFNSIWDCEQLLREQLIDYLRMSVVRSGGITHLRRILHVAELYRVRSGFHGATDLSPVCMAAALALDMAIPNFGLQEYMRHTPETDAVFPHAYTFADGYLRPGEAPGLGVDIDEGLAVRYPYRAALLPVARLADGTMHDW
jgi:mannonate dehydratase